MAEGVTANGKQDVPSRCSNSNADQHIQAPWRCAVGLQSGSRLTLGHAFKRECGFQDQPTYEEV